MKIENSGNKISTYVWCITSACHKFVTFSISNNADMVPLNAIFPRKDPIDFLWLKKNIRSVAKCLPFVSGDQKEKNRLSSSHLRDSQDGSTTAAAAAAANPDNSLANNSSASPAKSSTAATAGTNGCQEDVNDGNIESLSHQQRQQLNSQTTASSSLGSR